MESLLALPLCYTYIKDLLILYLALRLCSLGKVFLPILFLTPSSSIPWCAKHRLLHKFAMLCLPVPYAMLIGQ